MTNGITPTARSSCRWYCKEGSDHDGSGALQSGVAHPPSHDQATAFTSYKHCEMLEQIAPEADAQAVVAVRRSMHIKPLYAATLLSLQLAGAAEHSVLSAANVNRVAVANDIVVALLIVVKYAP